MTGAILAGGKSARMGFDKAFISLAGKPLIEGIIATFNEVFDEVFIVANKTVEHERFDLRVIADIYQGAGSLGGIYTALFHSKSSQCFIAACDMPNLEASIIRHMLTDTSKHDILVPYLDDRYHPLHALYSKRCITHIEKMILAGDLKIRSLFRQKELRIKTLDEGFFGRNQQFCFVDNINTVEDLSNLRTEKE
jgi:molybdenum cofactor guanylyltransferase